MDKKKKIIVVIVALIFVGILAAFVKIMLFPSDKPGGGEDKISIITPKVDEKRIDRVSKIRKYTQGKITQGDGNTAISNFSRFEEEEKKAAEQEEDIIVGSGVGPETPEKLARQNRTSQPGRTRGNEEADSEVKELMRLQEQFLAQSQAAQQAAEQDYATSNEELESLLKTYDQYARGYYGTDPSSPFPSNTDSTDIAENRKKADERLASAKEKFSGSKHFQGAGSVNASSGATDLVPAETVDQSLLFNGSTIAIRTKKAIQLTNPDVLIPQGAVVYGRVSFSANRLFVDIQSYKEGDKLYPLSFKTFDFDGREGIHLGNRTWPKIPSQVAEDVYDFIYQRGTQASAFGGAQDIKLEDAQNIALLSASREISKEIFDKRRIMMPKKYNLWLNINP